MRAVEVVNAWMGGDAHSIRQVRVGSAQRVPESDRSVEWDVGVLSTVLEGDSWAAGVGVEVGDGVRLVSDAVWKEGFFGPE